jgi:hypothetical protein
MDYIEDERGSINMPGWLAVEDAKKRNLANMGLFTQAEHAAADSFLVKAIKAWFRSRVYINYRETFIAIKVAKPTAQDRVGSDVAELEKYCEKHGISARKTGTGLVYHMPRLDK